MGNSTVRSTVVRNTGFHLWLPVDFDEPGGYRRHGRRSAGG